MDYIYVNGELYHYGILGQKWGVRRFQNSDGSLTPEGRKRYSNDELRNQLKNDIDEYKKSHSNIDKYERKIFKNISSSKSGRRLVNESEDPATLFKVYLNNNPKMLAYYKKLKRIEDNKWKKYNKTAIDLANDWFDHQRGLITNRKIKTFVDSVPKEVQYMVESQILDRKDG